MNRDEMMRRRYREVHDQSIFIDATCPLMGSEPHIDGWIEGGVTVAAPTVGGFEGITGTMKSLGYWYELMERRPDLLLVREVKDIVTAKEQGKLGIIFHFQGTTPIENDLNLVRVYKELGVRMIQLAYNVKNPVADGCEERNNSGLSRFGVALVKELNKHGIIVDCSHTGYQSTYDAIEISTLPVVCSHSNAKALKSTARNVPDDQIKAIAATGGLIGMNGSVGFVSAAVRSTLDELIDHIDHVVGLAGLLMRSSK